MLITKDEFDAVPTKAKEKIELPGECESCGSDSTLFEVTEEPLASSKEWRKHFLLYCPKCVAYYKVKKNYYIKKD